MDYLQLLKEQFNNRIDFKEKRPGITQLIAPFYHEDGDMVDIFLEKSPLGNKIRICDYGMTLMRLSYSYEIDTPNKEKIFNKILTENNTSEEDGKIYLDAEPNHLYAGVFQFVQAVSKVSSMRLYKREVIANMFYELFAEFIETKLMDYKPIQKVYPLSSRDDLEVDYSLTAGNKPLYLFGVKDSAKARLTTISCLEFQKAKIPFKSLIIHDDFESLPKKDRSRLTSAADKQFTDLDDFKNNIEQYLEREAV